MVKIKLNDKKREAIKEINQVEYVQLPYDITKFISIFFKISIDEVLTAHNEGRLLITKDKKLFSSFLFKEWLESSNLKQENNSSDPLIEALWYDFGFINNSENVMRYSESRHGVNDDTLLHVFYENSKKKRKLDENRRRI